MGCRSSHWIDGIVLRADVFRPVGKGEFPAILNYGPYAKGPRLPGQSEIRLGADDQAEAGSRHRNE